ncbi:LysM peptidoglycan-binding domain-containing protein [Marilutibacter chinensis]|uniref:LysM peptidoglycan-binding domain-containing protein n=1 Tax=Marilutibacter chinensis TaxID=2912247 RepID=A0ABS9HUN6_9GAMM|nr:LysM domain-containing protein [Lysobacter chinensis]MCF7222580.1 LysM peptidoglycan-binding domain-containing protein [Lysobacter chinensis]
MERSNDALDRANQAQTYTVREDDALADIAERYGVTIQMLNAANPEHELSVRRLTAGQELVIPPAPMSVTAGAREQGFNPAAGASGSTFGVSSQVDGVERGLEWNPGDGSVKGSVQGSVPLPQLGGVRIEAGAGGSLESGVRNVDGNTVVSLSQEVVAASVKHAADAGQVSAESVLSAGSRVKYEVTLPGEDRDPSAAARIDPFDPTTIPDGATVTLNRQDFAGTALEASFRQIAISSQLREAEGVSYSITRDGDSVRVVMGPNEAVEAFNAVGVKTDVATAMLGRQDALGTSTLQTARFDLSSPDGQAAFAHFVGSGEVAHQTPGVSEVATIQRTDFNSQTRMKLGLGPEELRLQADLAGPANTGQFVTTTYPDGSYARTSDLQYSGNVPLQVVQRFDADGNELAGMRAYRFTVDTDRPEAGWVESFLGRDEAAEERAMSGMLNVAIAGDPGASNGPVQPGDKVVIEFNETQMRALMAQVQATSEQDRSWIEQREASGQPVENMEFAIAMARRIGSEPYAFSENLYRYSMGDPSRDGFDRIDATVRSEQGEVLSGTQWQRPMPAPELGTLPRDADTARMFDHLSAALDRGEPALDIAIRDVGASDHARGLREEAELQVDAQLRQAAEQEQGRQEAMAR